MKLLIRKHFKPSTLKKINNNNIVKKSNNTVPLTQETV